jgi:hypothetical protein
MQIEIRRRPHLSQVVLSKVEEDVQEALESQVGS